MSEGRDQGVRAAPRPRASRGGSRQGGAVILSFNPQHIILLHHFRRFLVEAGEAGIDVAPLKGAHLVTAVYPDDLDRGVMADVDFLVRPDDFAAACGILEGLGFHRKTDRPDWSLTHEESFYLDVGDGRQIMFEAHRYLFEPRRFPIDHTRLWERSVESGIDGVPCRRLAPEDNCVHIAFHAVVHRLMSLERTLKDLELMLRHGGVEHDLVVERARQWRVTRSVWLLARLLDDAHPDLGLAGVLRSLAPPGPVDRALRFIVPSGFGRTRLAGLHHRLQAAVLWPLVFDDPLQLARMVMNHPYARYLLEKAAAAGG